MLKGGDNETSGAFAKYIMIIIGYVFCFFNIFNKDDPYGLYLVIVSLLIITMVFIIFLTMDIEKHGIYLFLKNSLVLSLTSFTISSSLIINLVSVVLFIIVFDYNRKNTKDKNRKFVDPLVKPPYMIQKMTKHNESTFELFKTHFMISTSLIVFILGYFAFVISNGIFNKMFYYGDNYIENGVIILNLLAIFALQGVVLYYSVTKLIYSISFLQNMKRNIDIYPVIV